MSILRAFPIDFIRQGNVAYPVDRTLHNLAAEFSEKELAKPVNLSEYAKVWCAGEVEADNIVSVQGLMGFTMRPDFTLARFLRPEAIILLHDRANAYLADQGCRGNEVMVYLNANEKSEQKCPQGLKTILELGATQADRWLMRVK